MTINFIRRIIYRESGFTLLYMAVCSSISKIVKHIKKYLEKNLLWKLCSKIFIRYQYHKKNYKKQETIFVSVEIEYPKRGHEIL